MAGDIDQRRRYSYLGDDDPPGRKARAIGERVDRRADAARGLRFGGGPMACALIETVIDTIEESEVLPRVRALSRELRERCLVGPVTGVQGAGYLLGLRCSRPAKEIAAELLRRDIVVGTSADPHVVRLLPPVVLETAHVVSDEADASTVGADAATSHTSSRSRA